jgi:hypothetical protein
MVAILEDKASIFLANYMNLLPVIDDGKHKQQ